MELVFSNTFSKILLEQKFREQFYVPKPPSIVETSVLKIFEKSFSKKGYQDIKIEKPIFIIGVPRSGTSMLYDLLCAHESSTYISNLVAAYSETPLAVSWFQKKFNLNVESERFLGDSVNVSLTSPAEPFLYWHKWFDRDNSLHWRDISRSDFSKEHIQDVYEDIKKNISLFNKKTPRFICKFAVCQTEIRILQELFPDAKFVNIVRDGRDVAHSLIKLYNKSNEQLKKINHPQIDKVVPYPRINELTQLVEKFGATDVRCTAKVWEKTLELIQRESTSLNHYYEFKYEDLLESPQAELEKLFYFCELSWPNTERFNKHFQKIGKLNHKNNYSSHDLIESEVGETLKRYHYLK